MIVDADDELREATARGLKANGYKVLEARNPEDAGRIAGDTGETIHLIIADVDHDRKNPPEAVKAVAEASQSRLAYVSSETDAVLDGYGVLDHPEILLRKPYSAGEMAVFVRRVLEANPE
jgi:DNA-binding response OmpR family regulator